MINEKHKLGVLLQKISKLKAFDFYCSSVNPVSQKYGVTFVEMHPGVGYYQWRLNGDGWIKFSDADENIKPFLAQQYEEKKNTIKSELGDAFFKDDIFIVPDESFIFFREKDSGTYEFAIAAWGFKYPNRATGGELDYWVQKIPMQDLNIAFVWDGKKFPNLDFWFNNLPKKTESDGWFHLGGKVPVGTKYNIVTPEKQSDVLVVEQDKAEYIYDLTQYFEVEISAKLDGNPLENQNIELFYNQNTETISTNQDGKAVLRLPLVSDQKAQLSPQQPLVKVVCRDESREETPSKKDDKLLFDFDFVSPKTVKTIDVEIEIIKDGQPVSNAECLVDFNGENRTVFTNENGKCTTQFSLEIDDFVELPMVTVAYNEQSKSQTPAKNANEETLLFLFEETTPVEPPVEYVNFKVLDYGGYPMPDLDIVLTTKLKGEIPLKTDSDGSCKVPKEWLEDKEKINVKFTVSDEYQKTHDIHSGKKRKK